MMTPADEISPNDIRKSVGLRPFRHDIFLSYRVGKNEINEKQKHLVEALQAKLTPDVLCFDLAEENVPKVQWDAVNSARVIIMLIDERRQLHRDSQWGMQYKELADVADLYVDLKYSLSNPDDRKRASPFTLICYFGEESDRGRAIEKLLPEDAPGRPKPDSHVVDFLNSAVPAWRQYPEEGAHEPDAGWISEVIETVKRQCRNRRIEFATPEAQDSRARSGFDYQGYLGRRAPSWRRGFPFAQRPLRHGDTDVYAFEVNQSDRISLSALLEKPVKGGPGLTEISDVTDQVLNGRASCWVLGQPGAGKTTVLTEAAALEADLSSSERGERSRHPMVFELKRFNQYLSDLPYEKLPSTLAELMAQDIRTDGEECDARQLGAFLQNHPHSLYLDGFDELSEGPQIHLVNLIGQERLFHPQGRIIISSRTGYEHVGLDDFEKLTLSMLSSDQLSEFIDKHAAGLPAKRAEILRNSFDVVRENFGDDKAGAPLRTPFFLQLISQEHRWAKQISGSATTIYTNALSRFFSHITRHDESSLGAFDPRESLTELAWLSVAGKTINVTDIDRAVSKGLEGDAKSVREIRARRFKAIEQLPVLHEPDTYNFRHKIFAEHLAATDIARRWHAAAAPQLGRTAAKEARRSLVRDLIGDDPPFSHESPAHVLIDRVPHVFFDTEVFSELRSGQESEDAALARDYCTTLCAIIRDAPLASEDAAARAATALHQLIRALDGLRHSLPEDFEPCARDAVAAYRTQAGRWHPVDREMLLGALGRLDPGCWEAVTNLSAKEPLTLPSVELLVPIWDSENAVRVEVPPLQVARKPVLVGEYRSFCEAPDRYDSQFWPMLSPAERAEVERVILPSLSDPAASGQHEGEARFCVIGDAPNAYLREHWKEQQNYPFRPVTNVAWREAVAYALWLSAREHSSLRLPGPVEWSQLVSAVGAPDQLSEMNLRSAGLHMPSTIGVFPANRLGLFDFGSNVAVWLNQYDPTTLTSPWPPGNPGPRVYFAGASYLSKRSDAALVTCEPQARHRLQRHPWVGIWLVETG
ncbi:MAG: hypothetical protein QOD94_2873 [Alphaproteobacteria bacterium]|nr:hypothetical protein [Alphaproteobacteria bacterium]